MSQDTKEVIGVVLFSIAIGIVALAATIGFIGGLYYATAKAIGYIIGAFFGGLVDAVNAINVIRH